MQQVSSLLSRAPHADRPQVPVVGEMTLTVGRVHEICGAARRTLALTVAGQLKGPVIWITPAWTTEDLNGPGVADRIDPARLILVRPERSDDLLWSMEEALRAGVAPLVVAELPDPPGLTPVRRLHLAAETGSAEGAIAPLGLLLLAGDGGAQGIESRWSLAPMHGPARSHWRLDRLRARSQPPKSWALSQTRPGGETERLTLQLRKTQGGDHVA